MDWEQHLKFRKSRGNIGDGMTDLVQIVAPVFTPVHGDQQMPFSLNTALYGVVRAGPLLCINNRIAREINAFVRDALCVQRFARSRRRREVEACESRNHLAQPFFRKRAIKVISP